MWLGINFFWEAKFHRQKVNWTKKENKFGELSTEEIQEITDNAIPVTTEKP